MKRRAIYWFLMLLLPLYASAHMGDSDPFLHASEHLLLAILLVPVAWLLLPRLKAVFTKKRRK